MSPQMLVGCPSAQLFCRLISSLQLVVDPVEAHHRSIFTSSTVHSTKCVWLLGRLLNSSSTHYPLISIEQEDILPDVAQPINCSSAGFLLPTLLLLQFSLLFFASAQLTTATAVAGQKALERKKALLVSRWRESACKFCISTALTCGCHSVESVLSISLLSFVRFC